MGVERDFPSHAAPSASEQRAAARPDELKTALLSSVRHDLRTPLTTISASAPSLTTFKHKLEPDTADRLLRGIVDECARLDGPAR